MLTVFFVLCSMPDSLCGNRLFVLSAHPFLTALHSSAHQPPEGDKAGRKPGSQGHTKVTGGRRFLEAPRWEGLGLEGALYQLCCERHLWKGRGMGVVTAGHLIS